MEDAVLLRIIDLLAQKAGIVSLDAKPNADSTAGDGAAGANLSPIDQQILAGNAEIHRKIIGYDTQNKAVLREEHDLGYYGADDHESSAVSRVTRAFGVSPAAEVQLTGLDFVDETRQKQLNQAKTLVVVPERSGATNSDKLRRRGQPLRASDISASAYTQQAESVRKHILVPLTQAIRGIKEGDLQSKVYCVFLN